MTQHPQGQTISISTRATRGWVGFAGSVFGFILFAGVGGALFYFMTVRPFAQWHAAQRWVETPCRVTSSGVRSHNSDDGATYRVEVRYEYVFDGRAYTSGRYNFMTGSSSGYEGKQAIVDRYPAGADHVCYVNPAALEEAVLNRDWALGYCIGLFGLLFVGAGFGILRLGTKRRRSVPGPQLARAPRPLRPVALKTSVSPMGKVVGSVFVTLFWNGIVAVFLRQAFQGEWFLFIFMLPFIAVGLVLVGMTGYFVLALSNPRIRIGLIPAVVPLGETAVLDWTLWGAADRIRTLRLWLVGKESVTYTEGTKTRTESSTFHKQVLFETQDLRAMRVGRVALTVPNDSMHSFLAPHNRVQWWIRVHGAIDRWPDVEEEYEITVLPHTGGAG